jgi:S1-C subfamily serine protease
VGRRRISPLRVVELLVVAIAGAAAALGGAAAFGQLGGDHTTIERIASPRGGTRTTSTPAVQTPTTTTGTRGLSAETIYAQDAPGVVQITATTVTKGSSDPFFPTGPTTEQSLGSGFVIDKAGHIVTNYHVVKGAQKVQVSFSGQDQLTAKVVGKDPSTDVAVLKIDAHARALTPIPLGNSDGVRVGDPVYAIGNPFGFTRTLTTGVVSAVQRQLEGPTVLPIEHAIQTDAAINHGNSGGPLIDAGGKVIGVTSQISTGNTGQQGNLGIGFAIPINTVRNVAAQIIRSGKVEHAYLGIETTPVTKQLAKIFNLPRAWGLLVAKVTPNTGAAKSGLRGGTTTVVVGGVSYSLGGDLIVGVDGTQVRTYEQLRDAIAQRRPGDEVKLDIIRDGKRQTVTVQLGQAPK